MILLEKEGNSFKSKKKSVKESKDKKYGYKVLKHIIYLEDNFRHVKDIYDQDERTIEEWMKIHKKQFDRFVTNQRDRSKKLFYVSSFFKKNLYERKDIFFIYLLIAKNFNLRKVTESYLLSEEEKIDYLLSWLKYLPFSFYKEVHLKENIVHYCSKDEKSGILKLSKYFDNYLTDVVKKEHIDGIDKFRIKCQLNCNKIFYSSADGEKILNEIFSDEGKDFYKCITTTETSTKEAEDLINVEDFSQDFQDKTMVTEILDNQSPTGQNQQFIREIEDFYMKEKLNLMNVRDVDLEMKEKLNIIYKMEISKFFPVQTLIKTFFQTTPTDHQIIIGEKALNMNIFERKATSINNNVNSMMEKEDPHLKEQYIAMNQIVRKNIQEMLKEMDLNSEKIKSIEKSLQILVNMKAMMETFQNVHLYKEYVINKKDRIIQEKEEKLDNALKKLHQQAKRKEQNLALEPPPRVPQVQQTVVVPQMKVIMNVNEQQQQKEKKPNQQKEKQMMVKIKTENEIKTEDANDDFLLRWIDEL